jgi:hypothetical protein
MTPFKTFTAAGALLVAAAAPAEAKMAAAVDTACAQAVEPIDRAPRLRAQAVENLGLAQEVYGRLDAATKQEFVTLMKAHKAGVTGAKPDRMG